MDVVFFRCAGLDVHKKSITACRIVPDPTGQETEGVAELRTFGTMPAAALWDEAAGVHDDQLASVLWYLKLATTYT
jgi:hypothetical protein